MESESEDESEASESEASESEESGLEEPAVRVAAITRAVHATEARSRTAAQLAIEHAVKQARQAWHGEREAAEERVRQVTEVRSKNAAEVAIAWQLGRGVIAIPKSVSVERIAQNFRASAYNLTPQDVAEIGALDENVRFGWGGPLVERDGQTRPRDEAHPDYAFRYADPCFF